MTHFIKTVLWVLALSVVGNIVLTAIGRLLSAPPDTFGPYAYGNVVGLTVAGVIAAALVYIAMRAAIRGPRKANRYFLILSVVVLIASFYPDIMLPYSPDPDDIGWTYGIIANLMLMHVLAGVVVMYYFTRVHRD